MKKFIKVLLWIIAVVLVIAALGVLLVRFVVLPKLSDRLQQSGRGELAAIVEQNNNLGAFASLTSLLSDRGMLEFMKNIDRESVSSAIDILDTLDAEISEEEEAEAVPSPLPEPLIATPWAVEEVRQLPVPTPIPKPTPKPTPTPTPSPTKKPETAYDRISSVASKKEMSDGINIIGKLDMGYLSSLLSGGLTASEKKTLKQYIYSKLTKQEISRALELYKKYKGYL